MVIHIIKTNEKKKGQKKKKEDVSGMQVSKRNLGNFYNFCIDVSLTTPIAPIIVILNYHSII